MADETQRTRSVRASSGDSASRVTLCISGLGTELGRHGSGKSSLIRLLFAEW